MASVATKEPEARPLTQTMAGDPNYQNTVMQAMMRALGDKNVKLELGEDDTLKTTYRPMLQNLQAQAQASEGAGLPSYEGIDAQNVMQLMAQRTAQDQQFRQQPLDLSQMNYQGALASQARAQPGMKMMDMLRQFQQSMEANKTARDVAGIKAKGSILDQLKAITFGKLSPEDQSVAMFASLKDAPPTAKVQLIEYLTTKGDVPRELATQLVTNPASLPGNQAVAILKSVTSGGISKLGRSAESLVKAKKDIQAGLTPKSVAKTGSGLTKNTVENMGKAVQAVPRDQLIPGNPVPGTSAMLLSIDDTGLAIVQDLDNKAVYEIDLNKEW